ncbi:uncharacterized protein LOC107267171 isoform X2 [Cephus cinctus]|uniref:Uncharacterized protein LOC107267171 isoform X2 n=1 Tax=Cephus cinctus TaxID=211228 RepID=A0AAJ7BTL5_CEPCN|nr:uncharacterized protein LOC107267171 isoform X2 [Cephus cinctus]XP_024940188.1 uncharacterized protein LOC107267171 isoform X2 [Cephus cinctus]
MDTAGEKIANVKRTAGGHFTKEARYTGHCPTLKFRVGKRFGACTEEIMKAPLQELLEKEILKNGPYRPASGKEVLIPIVREKDIRRDWKNDAYLHKAPPYILGYTGYIPGFNNRYGLPFKKAVEEGRKEWRDTQNELRAKRDALRAHVERTDPRNLLARARADNVDVEIDHGHDRDRTFFEHHVSPEKPPIVGYTGHIPGAKGEVALSKRYAQAARRGLELIHKERAERYGTKDKNAVQRVLDVAYLDETGHSRA